MRRDSGMYLTVGNKYHNVCLRLTCYSSDRLHLPCDGADCGVLLSLSDALPSPSDTGITESREMNVESQINSVRPRPRCLDVFLVSSVALLFVTVAVVVFMGTVAVSEIQAKIGSKPPAEYPQVALLLSNSTYKMENFVFLRPTSSQLSSGTMSWSPVKYGENDSIGARYTYSTMTHALATSVDGMYFLYVELHFICTAACTKGKVTVRVENHKHNTLTCEVALPAWPRENVEHQTHKVCWTVTPLDSKSKLLSHMEVPKDTADATHWKLDLNKTAMGGLLMG
ncbi:hypothetical protein DPEC_G00169750 [Dallia pectoralis]|uniref:Uncharacterized protein n=1 Tax=Dallia pectoralis TaxID=75939 RepID=A0ACC2GD79_DALPE|nr:hypothetical protein DPEC_G00169750 [Dallia pectoralis]